MKLDLSGLEQFRASSLLEVEAAPVGAPLEVSLDLIDFDPLQPRRAMNPQALAELAGSMRLHGVLEPVSLRSHPEQNGRFIVNRGERRVRACRLAGRSTVPAFVDERLDPYAQVVENLHREDLSVFDLARFIDGREREGDSRAEIARRLHKPRSFITEVAGLVDAPAPVREAFESGRTRDVRVLYQLARACREDGADIGQVLAGDGPISRHALEAAAALHRQEAVGGCAATAAPRTSKVLLVGHRGRQGWLSWTADHGASHGEVEFEDGSREVLALSALSPVAWARR